MLELGHDQSPADDRGDTAAAVLAALREDRCRGGCRRGQNACRPRWPWRSDVLGTAARRPRWTTARPGRGRRTGAPLAGEFSVIEFAAAIELLTEVGKAYLGRSSSSATGLTAGLILIQGDYPSAGPADRPDTMPSVEGGGRPRRLALAHIAHKVRSPAQLDWLTGEEATGRFMPEEAERRRRQAADGRYFHHRHPATLPERHQHRTGELDLADALDLDAGRQGRRCSRTSGPPSHWTCGRANAVGTSPAANSPSTSTPPPRRPSCGR